MQQRIHDAWVAIQRRIGKWWLDFRCHSIRNTPPIICNPDSKVVIVSQIYHPDVTMYLLAAKSFAKYVRPKKFVLVDDGLTASDRRLLQHHLHNAEFIPRTSIDTEGLPTGGCWERLLTLAQQNHEHFAIQLDSDTLTLSSPSEVLACINGDRTFTLGTRTGRKPVPLSEASRFAQTHTGTHVQTVAEVKLGEYAPEDPSLLYVRGCAGFAGFAPGRLDKNKIRAFSLRMAALCGPAKWSEWGSEQVTSNFFAANAPDSLVLPVEAYPFWAPDININAARFVHFFGTFRFTGGMYTKKGVQIVHQANATGAA